MQCLDYQICISKNACFRQKHIGVPVGSDSSRNLVPSERHVCYTLRQGSSYAAADYATPGDVYAFLRPNATFHLAAIAIYRMLLSPHICFGLRCCHLLQYSLCFGYFACCCICFSIIIFYMSEIYCPIFILSSTMPSVLHIMHWSIIGLRCFVFIIHIVAILALIPIAITGTQVKPTMPSILDIPRWSIIVLRCFILLIRICVIAILPLILVDINGSDVKPLEFSRDTLSSRRRLVLGMASLTSFSSPLSLKSPLPPAIPKCS